MVGLLLPKFTYDDVVFSVDEALLDRAVTLFKTKKITGFNSDERGYWGVVKGSKDYRVSVSRKRIDLAGCDCYMGENGDLCKHVLALCLEALYQAKVITPTCADY